MAYAQPRHSLRRPPQLEGGIHRSRRAFASPLRRDSAARVPRGRRRLEAWRHLYHLAFSENEAFLFCGLKLFHFRLPPFFRHSFSVNLVPVRIGEVCLPTPKLFCVTTGEEVLDSAPRHHHVFVRPSEARTEH